MFLESLRYNFIQNRLQQRSGLSSSKNVISIILKKEKETKFSENLRSKINMYSLLDQQYK